MVRAFSVYSAGVPYAAHFSAAVKIPLINISCTLTSLLAKPIRRIPITPFTTSGSAHWTVCNNVLEVVN